MDPKNIDAILQVFTYHYSFNIQQLNALESTAKIP